MTKAEIMRMAREAGVFTPEGYCATVSIDVAERFATLVAAAEREAWREESERAADSHLKQGLTIAELFEQRDALLEALKMIAGAAPCVDNLMSDKDIARAAIAAAEGEGK